MKICEACGIKMENPVDFATNNPDGKYCRHCVDDFDELKSYEEIFANLVGILMLDGKMTPEEAASNAKETLSKLPAWKK